MIRRKVHCVHLSFIVGDNEAIIANGLINVTDSIIYISTV